MGLRGKQPQSLLGPPAGPLPRLSQLLPHSLRDSLDVLECLLLLPLQPPPPLASSKLAGVGDVGTAAWWGGRAKDRDGAVLSLVMKVGLRQEDRLKAWVSWCEAAGGIGGRESVAAIEKKVAASMKSGDYGQLEFADASLVRTIDVDLQRTLTDHPQFKEGGGAEMLKRVLLCTALTVPDVGYLQGMNFLGAFLHLTFPEATSQELVLVLSTMVTKVLPG